MHHSHSFSDVHIGQQGEVFIWKPIEKYTNNSVETDDVFSWMKEFVGTKLILSYCVYCTYIFVVWKISTKHVAVIFLEMHGTFSMKGKDFSIPQPWKRDYSARNWLWTTKINEFFFNNTKFLMVRNSTICPSVKY